MSFDKYRDRGAYHYAWYEENTFNYKDCVDACVEFCKGSVLDLGCGEGLVVDLLQRKGLEATGIDSEQSAVSLADIELDVRFGSIYDSFIGEWDYMVCLNVIEHLAHPERVKEIFSHNITKGAIIITDIPGKDKDSYHVHEFTPYELKQLFHTHKVVPFTIGKDFHGVKVYK